MDTEIEIAIPETCALCRRTLGRDAVIATETTYPGLELDGDPLRLVGWCPTCVPTVVKVDEELEHDTQAAVAQARTRGRVSEFEP